MFLRVATAAAAGLAPARPLARAASTTAVYPYSKLAIIPPTPPGDTPASLKKGKGLLAYLQQTIPSSEKQQLLATLFSRRSPQRLLPGSVLTVELTHAPHTFSGILLSVRRRGPDTSFTLRNVIARTGVEMQFFVNSPHVKAIKVLRRASHKHPDIIQRIHRAKLNFLRHNPERMAAFAGGIKLN
ncbi:translation protein SH3-like domain-containing protein [Vararia minispora EC-137]|uniref:Translation protein SH3-like domain-containing protein n=1 Tax=Vararia minispora EC-137 TaxID=1314806 RepID=A0ACB8Q6R9_9AGAM|nr:translation protein SH3-like domain-containing protein [Vararia minispora EC-137]